METKRKEAVNYDLIQSDHIKWQNAIVEQACLKWVLEQIKKL